MSGPTIVLVHGAWHGAYCWDLVTERLRHAQRSVVAFDNPSSGTDPASRGDLADDVAALQGVLDGIDGDKVVVGHSYGGIVITQGTAGRDDVSHLLYVTAFMLDEGESLFGALGGDAPPWIEVVEGGGATVATRGMEIFYNDLAHDQEALGLEQRLEPQSMASFTDEVTAAGWHDISSTYVVCEQDNAIPPEAQRQMAQRADEVVTLDSSHSPMLSVPEDLVSVITGIA